ncbi:YxcD family protein [Paenibacillus oryzisoli]|uniref:YxcD family protein n=1 Tax=Paenibacillus oryzisoli TaxID=1850517 RepID=UPI003D2DA6A3
MRLSEQDIVNALCLHMAQRKGLKPTDVDVELMWDEDLGFSAEVHAQSRSQILTQSNMFEAIVQYLYNEFQLRVFWDQIRLSLEEEIVADIAV